MPDVPGTVNYPATLDSAVTLIEAGNNASSQLTTIASDSDTTLTVTSTTSFPESGAVSIDDEIIFYGGIGSATVLYDCVRGQDGTTAASHASGATVQGLIVATHHNTLASALIQVETKLGSGSSTPTDGKTMRGTGSGTSEWTDKLVVLSSGNVGIGTTTPTSPLTIDGHVDILNGLLKLDGVNRVVNGYFVAGNGDAVDPTYTFASDNATGIFRPATGIMGFSTGSTERMRIDASGRVGVGTTSPNSVLHVAGPVSTAFATKTASYTIGASDSVIAGNATGGAFTVTLPTAVGIAGRQYTIKKIDSSGNAVTVDGAGSETIDGAATVALTTQWARTTIVSNGTNWLII